MAGQPIFAYRSNTITAARSYGGLTGGSFVFSGFTAPSVISHASAIGGNCLQLGDNNGCGLVWNLFNTWTNTIACSVLVRVKFNNPSGDGDDMGLFCMAGGIAGANMPASSWGVRINGSSMVRLVENDGVGANVANNLTIGAINYTNTAWYDFVFTNTGQTAAACIGYLDGTEIGSTGPSSGGYARHWDTSTGYSKLFQILQLGGTPGRNISAFKINEFIVWDKVISGASIASVFTGASRSSFYSITSLDGAMWTSLTAAQIESGVNQIQAGITQTGAYACPTSTNPGATNVRNTIGYTINNTSFTGSLVAPTAAQGASGTVDLVNIKEQIRYILYYANTTTGDPINLSNNMVKTVNSVVKYHPAQLPMQASLFPAVCIWVDEKTLDAQDISRNQRNVRRHTKLNISIAGIVYNDNMTDSLENPADEDVEYLMENIELILRAHETLGNSVSWQFPTKTEFHATTLGKTAQLKAGIITLECTVVY